MGLQLPRATAAKPIYETSVYADELAGADEMIQEIIKQNHDDQFN